MRLNILIGGKAGQGINKVSEILAGILAEQGYFTFNYRDYQSLIRGGHNFNVLSISDEKIGSTETKLDILVPLDEKTSTLHKNELKKDGIILDYAKFSEFGKNMNLALAGAVIKILGIDKKILLEIIKKEFNNADATSASEKGYESQKSKFSLKKLKNKIQILTGSKAVALGAINSGMNLYMSYPMTPATGVMVELANKEVKENFMVYQPESEIAVANAALGASFTGAKTMIGTSGGGYDLMTEALSLQGITEIPLVLYLASRPGPATGVPTYTAQADLDVALRAGHGEFPRIVIAPGNPIEAIEKTNEAFYLAEKFSSLAIILSDKHLAESEFSSDTTPNKSLNVEVKRLVPGENSIVKTSSYTHNEKGDTVETPKEVIAAGDKLLAKYNSLKDYVNKNLEMFKIHGNKNSKNLIVSFGSTKGAILDAIDGLDVKFLQVLYIKPMSDKIREEIFKAKNIILVENDSTGQLGRIIREKTGIKIENRILKYDGRPFFSDELTKYLQDIIK